MNKSFTILLTATIFALIACSHDPGKIEAVAAGETSSSDPILTILPFDAIPAIKAPQFVSANEAKLDDNAPVIGVSLNGEHHAYSTYLLNGHEIVNDVVGGIKLATTW